MSLITERKLKFEEFLALPEGGITYELVGEQAVPKDKPISSRRFHSSVQKRLL